MSTAARCVTRQRAVPAFSVFVVFTHEYELRNGDPVRFLQLFTRGAAGEGDNRFGGEHPCVQEWNDAGYKDAAFLY